MALQALSRALLSAGTDDNDNIEEDATGFAAILLLIPFCLFLGNMTRYLMRELYIPIPYTVMLLWIGIGLGLGMFSLHEIFCFL